MYKLLILIPLIFGTARDLNEKGNKLYHKKQYKESLEAYKKAQVKEPTIMKLDYNIGCPQYKLQSYPEALQAFTKITSSLESKELKENAFYNLGNTMFKGGNLQNAVEMYKQALRLNPNDLDAKINLEFAQKMLKEGQKSQDQQKQDQQKQDQQKQEQQKQKQQQKEEQKKEESKISQDAAKSLLEALQQDEKHAKEQSQKKMARKEAVIIKDW